MPKKKMQKGGTFLGPFAAQTGQITPRQQFAPGFVPTRTGTTEPTITLPGQEVISPGSFNDPVPALAPEQRREQQAKIEAQQIQANIDPDVGFFNVQDAIIGGEKAGMSRDQVLASSIGIQRDLVGYDPEKIRNDPFFGTKGIFQSALTGIAKGGKTIIPAALTGSGAIAGAAILGTAYKGVRKSFSAPSYTATTEPTRQTFDRPPSLYHTQVTEPIKVDTPAVTFATVGSELFGSDPTYAGGAKTGADGLYATGGSGSFSSIAHLDLGISQKDESNLVAQGRKSGVFSSTSEGRQTVDALVANGHSQDVVEAVAKGETSIAEINQLGAAVGVQETVDPGVDAPKVICAELYRQGLLEKEIFELDEEFGRHLRKVDPDLIKGYHQWALPLVSLMQRSIVVSHIIKIIARPVVKHIAYQMGYPSKTYLGAALFTIGKHICRYIAKKEMAHA